MNFLFVLILALCASSLEANNLPTIKDYQTKLQANEPQFFIRVLPWCLFQRLHDENPGTMTERLINFINIFKNIIIHYFTLNRARLFSYLVSTRYDGEKVIRLLGCNDQPSMDEPWTVWRRNEDTNSYTRIEGNPIVYEEEYKNFMARGI